MATTSVPTVPRMRSEPRFANEWGRRGKNATYFREGQSPFLMGWRPQLREQSEDVRAAWQTAAARAVDQMQNSGFIAGIIEHSIASVVGPKLALSISPDAKALGWSDERAESWAEMVENRFAGWGNDPRACDAGCRMTIGQMQQLAYLSWMIYGETLGGLPMVKRRGVPGMTKVLLLPPSRLSQRTSQSERIHQGVRIDEFTAPVSYFINRQNPLGFRDEVEIQAEDADGRRNIVHVYEPSLGATRGISMLVPALKTTRQLDQTFDATVTTTLLQTIFAATVKTNFTNMAAFEGLLTERDQGKGDNLLEQFGELKSEWYDGAKIDLMQHGRIAHLFPNDELQFHEAKHPSQTFDMLMAWLNREVARCAGVTYESATGDYRNSSYSASRMGISMEWGIVAKRRGNAVVPFSNPVFDAWLEEEIGEERIEFPGGLDAFLAQRALATARSWTGPPKPQPDDIKAAKAVETLKANGVGNLAIYNAEYGIDWRDNMEQRARERKYAERLGLPDPYPPPPPPDKLGDALAAEPDKSPKGQ